MAGAAAATATAVALAPVQVTPRDIAVPAHPTSTQPVLSQAMVELLAAASRMTAAVPVPPKPLPTPGTGLISGPTGASGVSGAAPTAAVTVTPTATPIAPNLANTIDQIYITVEPWVRYGFEVAAYAVSWIPYVGGLSGLIMDGYNFGQSIVASAVFNTTDWLRGNGTFLTNLVDFGVDVGLAFVWLGIDVANTFVPLPPIPLPPRPPLQGPFGAATGATLAAPTASVGATPANALKGLTAANPIASLLNAADGQLTVKTAAAVDGQTSGATGTEKNPVQTVVADLEAATSGAADQLKNAAGDLKNSVETVAEKVVKQLPGTTTTTQTADVTGVPKSVRQSLQPQKPATTGASTSPRSLVKDVRDGVSNATADLKSNVQKATDGLRNAVTNAGKTKTKTVTKTDNTGNGDNSAKDKSDKSGGE
jgi:hypothetical protein